MFSPMFCNYMSGHSKCPSFVGTSNVDPFLCPMSVLRVSGRTGGKSVTEGSP